MTRPMVFWIILAVLVGIIVLIMLIPVGADIRYEDDIVRISLKAAWLKLQLLPRPKKKAEEEKPKKEEKPKEEKKPEEKPKEEKKLSLPFNFDEIIELLKVVIESMGSFSRKVSVDRFVLHWICPGSWDPYLMARIFGVVNAGLSQLAPLCIDRFQCRDSSVWTDIDFVRDDMKLEFCLVMTIRIGRIVVIGLKTGAAVLKIYLRSKRRRKREDREEKQALEKWLQNHPESRALLEQQEIPKSA
ncbi:MAG: hypothetical protein IKS55_01505 [Oscillospiraceae bacterium]|nr:hypothetical protein [Oscillospiraceae bacterium]